MNKIDGQARCLSQHCRRIEKLDFIIFVIIIIYYSLHASAHTLFVRGCICLPKVCQQQIYDIVTFTINISHRYYIWFILSCTNYIIDLSLMCLHIVEKCARDF